MPVTAPPGTPATPEPRNALPPSSRPAMDAALETLRERRVVWTTLPILERIDLLRSLRSSFAEVAEEWATRAMEAEGLDPTEPRAGEEWISGPYFILRNLRLLQISLRNISVVGKPRIPGAVERLPNGQIAARVFPFDLWDRIFYPGVTADVWMEPGVTEASLPGTQAEAYEGPPVASGTALVLGAGNVSSIGPMDALYKLFVEHRVVVYKTHPVNDYLGPILERGFRPLVEAGFLRIVYGGAEEGSYLCRHELVDEIHITGSDKTYEAIVFGPGEEGERRKEEREPLLDKPVSAELGNVSPVVVVPGRWSDEELAYHAENIATMLVNNAGFNCNAARVVVTHREWPQRRELLDAIRDLLARVPPRKAYYPGARDRFETFVASHSPAELFGDTDPGELPWALLPDVDPADDESLCFTTESFCSVFCEVGLSASSPVEYLERATGLCNETLWGTLNATLIVHPDDETDPDLGPAVTRAVEDLRYGTVSVNHWAAIGYGIVVAPWGAYPGHPPWDIQSGTGVVHNTLMFSRSQKTVVRAPFTVWPKPPWFVEHETSCALAERLTRFEASPGPTKLPGIFARAIAGGSG